MLASRVDLVRHTNAIRNYLTSLWNTTGTGAKKITNDNCELNACKRLHLATFQTGPTTMKITVTRLFIFQ